MVRSALVCETFLDSTSISSPTLKVSFFAMVEDSGIDGPLKRGSGSLRMALLLAKLRHPQQWTLVVQLALVLTQNQVALLSAAIGSALTILAASGGGWMKERRKRKAIALALEIEARHNSKAMQFRLNRDFPFVLVRDVLGQFDQHVELFDPTTIFLVGEYRSALLQVEEISASYTHSLTSENAAWPDTLVKSYIEVVKATDVLVDTVSAHLKNLPWWGMKIHFGMRALLRLSPPPTPGINLPAPLKK